MASVIDSMEDLGRSADKTTDSLKSTAVAMKEVEKAAVAMAKSVSGAVKELVKMTLIAKGMVKAILAVVVGIKMLIQAVSQATTAFGEWIKYLRKVIVRLGAIIILLKTLPGYVSSFNDSINSNIEGIQKWKESLRKIIVRLGAIIILLKNLPGYVSGFNSSITSNISVLKSWIDTVKKIVVWLGIIIFELGVIKRQLEALPEKIDKANSCINQLTHSLKDMEETLRETISQLGWFGLILGVIVPGISGVVKLVLLAIGAFVAWKTESTLLGDALTVVLEILIGIGEIISDIINDFNNGGFWDGGWFDVFGSGGATMNVNEYANLIPGQSANILSGISDRGLSSVYGGNTNTTNITYNVSTTKDMSLRNAERERRLYTR